MTPRNLSPTELKRLHRSWRQRTHGRLALLLDEVQTSYNVGGIVRTAAALRVDHVWLVGDATPPDHPKVHKTALGTQRYLTWTHHETPEAAAGEARAAGYRVVGVELAGGAVPLFAADLTGDVCLALGHEDRGLSTGCLDACDIVAFIPQLGRVGSLNVATAAGMAMYEVRRQAWTAPEA